MASAPLPFAAPSEGARLDSPPPLPPGVGGTPGPQPLGVSGGPGQPAPGAGLMQIGQQVQEALLLLSQALPQGAAEFYQALEAVKAGLAKGVEAQIAIGSPPPTASPVATGPQFPGGGIGGGAF